jgi:hypothetical protein
MPGRVSLKKNVLPIRWNSVPHQDLWRVAQNTMTVGSRERSQESSLRYVLKRRLPKLDTRDHERYIELECCRIVELLRALRDQYRRYFEDRGATPLMEMQWLVCRFGVKEWAIMVLREAVFGYINNSSIDEGIVNVLYGPPLSVIPLGRSANEKLSIQQIVDCLLHKDAFDEVVRGGPFGRQNQLRIGRSNPDAIITGRDKPLDRMKDRQELWDECRPWTEGMAMLFDAAQEELFFQFNELGSAGRQAELELAKLTPFQTIAYSHMNFSKGKKTPSGGIGDDGWLALLRDLDKAQLNLKEELSGKAKLVLAAARKKGHLIDKWEVIYRSKVRVSLDDGKQYALKREVMHAIHNACRAAEDRLAKIWPKPMRAK